jgi:signal recognition particle subunit SRP19
MEKKNLRKQEKAIIWSAYFDISKTRMEGRRVPKNLALPSPRIVEIEEAAEKLGLPHELIVEKAYPKNPWQKAGMVLVEKQGSKEKVINKIARQMQKSRSEVSQKK